MPVLELHDVRKTYPGEPPVESVRGMSLAVEAGPALTELANRGGKHAAGIIAATKPARQDCGPS